MVKFITTIFLISLLVGCSPVPQKFERELPPSYLVMVTNDNVRERSRCAGIIVDYNYVITAAHCLQTHLFTRVIVTQYNQEVQMTGYYFDLTKDIALIKTNIPMYTEEFPTFDDPKLAQTGKAYGLCSRYFFYNPRFVLNMGQLEDNKYYSKYIKEMPVTITSTWRVMDEDFKVCLGDSGGIVIQDGKVVGLLQAILAPFFTGIGDDIFSLGGKEIEKFVAEGKEKLK